MGFSSVDYQHTREGPVPGFASAILFVVMSAVVEAVLDGERGRTFILNPNVHTWQEANDSCRKMNGTLATIDHFYVIPDMGYPDEWTLWVGLKINSSEPVWEYGTKLRWTNWHEPVEWREGREAVCTAAITSMEKRFVWIPKACHQPLPSLCEVPEGTCRFNVTYHASLTGFNSQIVHQVRGQCLEQCQTMRSLDCRSLEAHRDANVCQLSNETRWTHPEAFALAERSWDYYHWTCINGTYLNGVYVSPNGAELPSTPDVTTEASTEATTSQAPEETTEETVCIKVRPPTKNETEEIKKEVEELQTMSKVYKEQSRQKKKTSRPDTRGSAATVGSLAVGLVVTIVLLIVLSDIISSPAHFRQMNRRGAPWGRWYRRMKKRRRRQTQQKTMQFTEYSEAHGSQVGPLVVGARVPPNYQPQNLHVDHSVEHVYSNGGPQSGHEVDQKLEQHLERIRQMEKEFGRLRKTRMAVSCPDLDHMDSATPGATDAQSDTSVQAEGACSPTLSVKSKNDSGTPRIRVMRLGSCKSQQSHNSTEHNVEQADVEIPADCDSQDEIKCSDFSSSLETTAAADRNIQFPNPFQNGQVPVLNTSKYIELTELKTLLHSQHFTSGKNGFPVKNPKSEDVYMQKKMNFKTQDVVTDNENDKTKTGRQTAESAAMSETVNAKASLPEQRPHVQIWIEEDHTPINAEHLPPPLDVDTRLLRVQEYPCSTDFKQRSRAKQSRGTCSDKILNTD